MAETPDRYCSNCGYELDTEDQFCPNCGSPVHEAATVPTPEADVPVPPPPPQTVAAAASPPQQAEGAQRPRSRRNLFIAGCLGLIGVLALLIIAIVAIVALSGGGDEPATKDDPPAKAPANTPESTPTSTPESTPTEAPADDTGTITMSDVKMAADENGDQPTTVFSPKDTFYCVGYLEGAPDDTKITAVWLAADIENIEPNSKIKQISATGGDGLFRFNLSPAESWPTGEYAVQLYLNDAEQPTESLTFEVR